MSDEAVTGSELVALELSEETRIANGIYGVIISTAVMAAEGGQSVGRLTVAVLVTLLVYWAAERSSAWSAASCHRPALVPSGSS